MTTGRPGPLQLGCPTALLRIGSTGSVYIPKSEISQVTVLQLPSWRLNFLRIKSEHAQDNEKKLSHSSFLTLRDILEYILYTSRKTVCCSIETLASTVNNSADVTAFLPLSLRFSCCQPVGIVPGASFWHSSILRCQ